MKEDEEKLEPYDKPELTKLDNLKEITSCDPLLSWSCTFTW